MARKPKRNDEMAQGAFETMGTDATKFGVAPPTNGMMVPRNNARGGASDPATATHREYMGGRFYVDASRKPLQFDASAGKVEQAAHHEGQILPSSTPRTRDHAERKRY